MAPIVPGQKRYAVLERALEAAKITQREFDHCLANGIAFSTYKRRVAPPPEELPPPSPALLAPLKKKKTMRFTEPFHGGVALMSLQEQFDSLADKVLQDVEEGIRRDVINHEIQEESKRGLWGFSLLGR